MKNNKYKILVDNESIITYDNVILDNDLLYKKKIDKELYDKILKDTNFYDIYNKVVKYILKKRKSEKEVLNYLVKFNLANDDIDKIINKLKGLKLINDIEYCKAFINDKIYLGKEGINKIRLDLLNQDIPSYIIEQELSNIDTDILDSRLEKIILKKIKSNHKYSNSHLKQKILNEMINLGYSKEKILDIVNKNLNDDYNIINKEFDKLYYKLKLKYSGVELENKLKQKLISKGFRLEEINDLLNQKTED